MNTESIDTLLAWKNLDKCPLVKNVLKVLTSCKMLEFH